MRRSVIGVALAALALSARVDPSRAAAGEDAKPAWEPERTWALLIGVLEWKDPSLASFPKPGRVDRVLEKTLLARGVPAEHLLFLEDRGATLAACREALAKVTKGVEEGGTLLFYFAGHGGLEGARAWFCPYDEDTKDPSTALSVDEVGRAVAARAKGVRLLLTADCCHSGALGAVVAAEGKAGAKAAALPSSLASNVSTGEWTFTESLVASLSGDPRADGNGDGRVTFREADEFVRAEMRFRAEQQTRATWNAAFEGDLALSTVDPARVRPRGPGPWQVGDYAEAEWKGKWYRAQVLETDGARVKLHYPGWAASWDEWKESKALRAPVPRAPAQGAAVLALWKKTWWKARVVKAEDDFALVHYDGFGPEWDEWLGPKRLRPREE